MFPRRISELNRIYKIKTKAMWIACCVASIHFDKMRKSPHKNVLCNNSVDVDAKQRLQAKKENSFTTPYYLKPVS